ncbi:MAG TPA: hypothetical protein VN045_15875, partial [Microbacteriaceae bacterium]|nr:hypothetical protein [Microbacteriaceae bacterium]
APVGSMHANTTPASSAPRNSARPASARNRRKALPVVQLAIQHRIAVGVTALALIAGISIAPAQAPAAAASTAAASALGASEQRGHVHAFTVDSDIVAPAITRDAFSATDGVQTLASNGTNEDWAKLVLMFGGWPQTDANVTVMLRWMRQENGPPDWWNRNNPLNNGYGSGGGAGLGSYPDLVTAAQYAAANLHRGYPDIVAGLAAGTSADVTAQAIWASPWASSHYGNGSHWSTAPVEIVQAPASAW